MGQPSLKFHKGFGSENFAFAVNPEGTLFKVVEFPRVGNVSPLVLVFECDSAGMPVKDVSDGNFPSVDEAVEHFALDGPSPELSSTSSTHNWWECAGCRVAMNKAETTMRVTGSLSATFRDGNHVATVSR